MVTSGDFDVSREVVPGGVTVLHVRGELDVATTPLVEERLAEDPAPRRLVVDLTACTFVDSSGLRLLVATSRAVTDSGGIASVVVRDPSIVRILEITGVRELLDVRPSIEDALEASS